jgi:hypothetical protein
MPTLDYVSQEVGQAAWVLSYRLEGVKDNRAINYLVANKLVSDREHYEVIRDELLTKIKWAWDDDWKKQISGAIKVLDEYHALLELF